MKGFKDFALKLHEAEREKMNKRNFCREHNFNKEADFLQGQISIIQNIRFQLEMVSDNHTQPNDVRFCFE